MIGVSGLTKDFELRTSRARAVNNVSFEVAQGEFFTLLGASGCGKSTTLRCIAGLEHPDSGTIEIGGRLVTSRNVFVPASKRRIGMVFQSYALWPHMTVFDNVAFPLHQHGRIDGTRIKTMVMETLRVVQMDRYADRAAPYLSGGQQQRVALARAIVGHPDVLLLDEPLSNLDARLRLEMRVELRRICKQVGITTLYVTHDQPEALALSDRIAVLRDGRVQQIGSPTEIYRQPASREVASFVGDSNFIEGQVVSDVASGQEAEVRSELGPLRGTASRSFSIGERVTLMLRPDVLRVAPESRRDGWNHLSGTIERVLFMGEGSDCVVAVAGTKLAIRVPSFASVEAGQVVDLRFRPAWAWILAADAGSPA